MINRQLIAYIKLALNLLLLFFDLLLVCLYQQMKYPGFVGGFLRPFGFRTVVDNQIHFVLMPKALKWGSSVTTYSATSVFTYEAIMASAMGKSR